MRFRSSGRDRLSLGTGSNRPWTSAVTVFDRLLVSAAMSDPIRYRLRPTDTPERVRMRVRHPGHRSHHGVL